MAFGFVPSCPYTKQLSILSKGTVAAFLLQASNEREFIMKAIKSIIILLVAIPAMAVYALFEAINALAIEIDLVRIHTMMRCCRKFKTL